MFRLLHNGNLERTFASLHELFDYDPGAACWFVRQHAATYFAYDWGEGLHCRFERVPEPDHTVPVAPVP